MSGAKWRLAGQSNFVYSSPDGETLCSSPFRLSGFFLGYTVQHQSRIPDDEPWRPFFADRPMDADASAPSPFSVRQLKAGSSAAKSNSVHKETTTRPAFHNRLLTLPPASPKLSSLSTGEDFDDHDSLDDSEETNREEEEHFFGNGSRLVSADGASQADDLKFMPGEPPNTSIKI